VSTETLIERPTLADVREVVRANAVATDHDAVFPESALAALRRSGLLGLLIPSRYGGMGASTAEMLRVASELSRDCVSVGMIYVMHCQQVAALVEHGRSTLRSTLLPRIARGEVYIASVTTEQGSGGNLLSASAALTTAAGTLHVDRMAPVVTGGTHADGFLITMRAPNASSPTQTSLVYADREQLDIEVLGDWNPMGMRATHSRPLKLTGDIPAHQVVGDHGCFRDIAIRTFAPLAHLGWASCWLGAADGALARTVALLRAERQTRDLGSELLLYRLSRARQRLDSVHALLSHATNVISDPASDITGPPIQLLLNAVKLTASEQCLAAVHELVELVGLRHGYLRGSATGLERTLRDLRSASLNYANERLHLADGALVLMDRDVCHAQPDQMRGKHV
jgi:acyl-CoA dehydrogenase